MKFDDAPSCDLGQGEAEAVGVPLGSERHGRLAGFVPDGLCARTPALGVEQGDSHIAIVLGAFAFGTEIPIHHVDDG